MKRLVVPLVSALAAAVVLAAGCAQTAPAPAPTQAPAAPAKATEPTKAPAAAPTKAAEPAKAPAPAPTAAPAKVDYPAKGRPITLIVPWNAGAGSDNTARLIAAGLEKELGTTFQIVNKPGASSQVGLTDLAKARPDGYTLGLVNVPIANLTYLDPERQAAYGRKDFQPVASMVTDNQGIVVRADSPFKGVKDMVDAAKAKPEGVTVGTVGLGGNSHLDIMALEQLAGVRVAFVHFDGGAPLNTALMGGHVDVASQSPASAFGPIKAEQMRVIGLMSKQADPLFPGAKSFAEQGYPLYRSITRSFAAPAGTPKEIVDILSNAVKKVLDQNDVKARMEEMALGRHFMNSTEFAALWDQADKDYKDLIQLIKKK